MNQKLLKQKGFTLIELMTAISIFLIVMVISMGSILGVFDANRKSKSLKTVMSNLNLAIESMSKEMRYGINYHCGTSGDLAQPQSCPAGDTLLSFLSSDDIQTTYRFNNGVIEKQVDGGDYIPITAPEVVIDDLTFYALGTGTSDTLQSKVNILIKGHAGANKGQSNFILQTLVSQRELDVAVASSYATPYSYPTPSGPTLDIDYLVVGGGGGGGNGPAGGGGGGGDVIVGSTSIDFGSPISITIGSGGSSATAGGYSDFGLIRASGGGAGATSGAGGTGANGGGGYPSSAGGSGTAGFNGGAGGIDTSGNSNAGGGGGGGDTEQGGAAWAAGPSTQAGLGGAGRANSYSSSSVVYGSGGGGGSAAYTQPSAGGSGAGTGGVADAPNATSGTANRGGGGGGAGVCYSGGATCTLGNGTGGSGGSGIVIVRYRTSDDNGATGGTITKKSGYTIHTFTSSGTFTP